MVGHENEDCFNRMLGSWKIWANVAGQSGMLIAHTFC